MQDFLNEIACEIVFEQKQSVKDAYDTDIFRYLDLLAIKLNKMRETHGDKKEYIDQISWL